jgi:hypothetical protein
MQMRLGREAGAVARSIRGQSVVRLPRARGTAPRCRPGAALPRSNRHRAVALGTQPPGDLVHVELRLHPVCLSTRVVASGQRARSGHSAPATGNPWGESRRPVVDCQTSGRHSKDLKNRRPVAGPRRSPVLRSFAWPAAPFLSLRTCSKPFADSTARVRQVLSRLTNSTDGRRPANFPRV